ncbi:AbrB/MazE/SpoVT family DNA-binding domain-containing protein [Opitutia bacterium ISCC 51]|nr:AbrB/MazE/SpoVT family DNA-binding domain-containing protein [Opitutae bacterium ISCC 51]QXD27139.1 AbrB/MazE/SpoVT family DNA-binding domain-containing protein [Opitutae bacterium ISCC 52]
MNTVRAKVTTKGQVTLPKPLRDTLDLHEGDHVEFALNSDQQISLVKLRKPGSSAGILKHLGKKKTVTVKEMDQAIAKEMAKKHGRT